VGVLIVNFMNGADFEARLAEWMIGDEVSEMRRREKQRQEQVQGQNPRPNHKDG